MTHGIAHTVSMANDRNSIPSQLRGAASGASSQSLMELQEKAADQSTSQSAKSFTPEELKRIEELKRLDLYVRQHESSHAKIGGHHATSPRFDFEQGPDGKYYAVGGTVSIDVSPVPGDPDATIRKMKQVRAAALAPADPSAQDHVVAVEAQARLAEAMRAHLAKDSISDSGEESLTINESKSVNAQTEDAAYDEMDQIFSRVSAQQSGRLPKGLKTDDPITEAITTPKKGNAVKSEA